MLKIWPCGGLVIRLGAPVRTVHSNRAKKKLQLYSGQNPRKRPSFYDMGPPLTGQHIIRALITYVHTTGPIMHMAVPSIERDVCNWNQEPVSKVLHLLFHHFQWMLLLLPSLNRFLPLKLISYITVILIIC